MVYCPKPIKYYYSVYFPHRHDHRDPRKNDSENLFQWRFHSRKVCPFTARAKGAKPDVGF